MPRTKAQNKAIRQARREQILEGARQVFAEQGFHPTRMSDIAKTVGVSQGTLYHYFGSKDELFLALLNTWNERVEEIVGQLPDSGLSAADKFWLINQVAVAFFEADEDLLPVLVEFWAYALHNPEATASFRNFFQVMQQSMKEILAEGIAAGEFKPVEVELLSALPLIILDGSILLAAVVGRDLIRPAEMVQKAQQLVFDGLLTAQGPTAP
jgi:AcrR family transcriptional regulator